MLHTFLFVLSVVSHLAQFYSAIYCVKYQQIIESLYKLYDKFKLISNTFGTIELFFNELWFGTKTSWITLQVWVTNTLIPKSSRSIVHWILIKVNWRSCAVVANCLFSLFNVSIFRDCLIFESREPIFILTSKLILCRQIGIYRTSLLPQNLLSKSINNFRHVSQKYRRKNT